MACWTCERPEGEGVFCQHCSAVLPPRTACSHFELLGVEREHALDLGLLERRYKELQKKLHPDRFARADARARRFALEQTTALNLAYRTLCDPVRRAEYLLSLHDQKSEIHRVGNQHEPKMEPAFLAEMLELGETIHQAKAEQKSAELAELAKDLRQRRAADLRIVAEGLARVRFYDRMLSTIEQRGDAA